MLRNGLAKLAMRLFFKVEDVFHVSERGCVIVPAIPEGLDFNVRTKDQIELRTPDGRILQTHIASVELAKRRNAPCHGDHAAAHVAKQDVPIGTEIWFLQGR